MKARNLTALTAVLIVAAGVPLASAYAQPATGSELAMAPGVLASVGDSPSSIEAAPLPALNMPAVIVRGHRDAVAGATDALHADLDAAGLIGSPDLDSALTDGRAAPGAIADVANRVVTLPQYRLSSDGVTLGSWDRGGHDDPAFDAARDQYVFGWRLAF